MTAFLREIWELWYWALFCPTRLQQRMNDWSPVEELTRRRSGTIRRRSGTSFYDILLARPHRRFLVQFALLAFLLTLPLIVLVALDGQPRDWIFVVVALLAAYGISIFFLPLGLYIPLLVGVVYLYQASVMRQSLDMAVATLPPFGQILRGITIGIIGLVVFGLLSFFLFVRQRIRTARAVLFFGLSASVGAGSWFGSGNLIFMLVIVFVALAVMSFYWRVESGSVERDFAVGAALVVAGGAALVVAGGAALVIASVIVDGVALVAGGVAFSAAVGVAFGAAVSVAFGAAVSVAGGIALVIAGVISRGPTVTELGIDVAGIVAFVVGLIVAGVVGLVVAGVVGLVVAGVVTESAELALPALLFIGWFVGCLLAPGRWRWGGLIAAGVLAALALRLGWLAGAVAAATLIGYYRLLPEYPPMALLSLAASRVSLRAPLRASRWLPALPPHSSELVWLPLPSHDRLLAAAFRDDTTTALAMLQQMRALALPGYQRTIARALPQIVADELATVTTLDTLITTTTTGRPILSLLIPAFYTDQKDTRPSDRLPPLPNASEIGKIMPRLQDIARQLAVAQETASSTVRGLELCRKNLESLAGQLSGLGLDSPAQRRWLPVLAEWQSIVLQEIERRKGIENPFLPGRVLTKDNNLLFKGRRDLAGELYQQLVSRGRPTMLLYGPRRSGKSSFLRHLPRLLPDDILPIFLDLQGDGATDSDANLCYSLARAIADSPVTHDLAFAQPNRTQFQANPRAQLSDWLKQVVSQLGSRQILLCLDEIEALGQAIADQRITLPMLGALRSLIQHQEQLNFLLCGAQTLQELTPYWSGYFINVVPVKILYLAEDDARDLLTKPDEIFADEVHYESGVVEHILAHTRCHPYLLQLIGDSLVTQSNRRRTTTITRAITDAAEDAALTPDNLYLLDLWQSFRTTEQKTAAIQAEIRVGQTLMRAIATGRSMTKPTTEEERVLLINVLRRLQNLHVIERVDGKYRFEVPLVARWVRERAVLD